MSDVYFGTDLFSELDRLQRQMSSLFGGTPSSLRSSRSGTFPPINVGTTDESVEIVAFAPGLDPAKLDVTVDKARELLGLVERAASWENPLPGIGLVHFAGG